MVSFEMCLDSPFEMWFRYQLQYWLIWVTVSGLNQNSGFGRTLLGSGIIHTCANIIVIAYPRINEQLNFGSTLTT